MIYSPEAQNNILLAAKYASLSRACLAVGDFMINTSVSAIDALLLGAAYHYSVDSGTEPHKGLVLVGVAMKLAVGVRASTATFHEGTDRGSLFSSDWTPVCSVLLNLATIG